MQDIFNRELQIGDYFCYVIRTSTQALIRLGIVTSISKEFIGADAIERDWKGQWKPLSRKVKLRNVTWIKVNGTDLPGDVVNLLHGPVGRSD